MGLLDGQIADLIYAGFKGRLLTATLIRDVPSAEKNDLGDPISVTTQTWSCEGFVDNYSAFYRAQAGIPLTDSKVGIFAKSLPDGISPQKDDRVLINNQTWQLRTVMTDPATALWECQSYRVDNV